MVKSKCIVYGKSGSGKTTFVNSLSESYENVVRIGYSLFESNSSWVFSSVKENTNLIIVDDIKNIRKVLSFFVGKFLVIDKPMEKQKIIECPNVVLICESIEGVKINKRKFNVIPVN